ncbi:MAG: hypothetical protein EGQ16_04330 [Clostridiales bacterium]|nr:hypothetical protein [Clostridiales bacterium]
MYNLLKTGNTCINKSFEEDYMRRERRVNNNDKKIKEKITMYSIIGVSALVVILVGLLIYSKSLSDNVQNGTMNLEKIAKQNEENLQNTTNTLENTNSASVSTEIGKSVEEAKNETTNNTAIQSNTNSANNTSNQAKNSVSSKSPNATNSNNTSNKKETNKPVETKTKEGQKELNFEKPVDGEIVKEYAKDNLVYSNTLQEWTTHLGIDIKADKTTVVKAAETGTVKTIKNDPRYGLTIVIEHENGYQTVYSNLLSSEFVVEGEKVEKGQSIGTVGNTAAFEIADEAHLHFEVLKDSIQVDPNIYLK